MSGRALKCRKENAGLRAPATKAPKQPESSALYLSEYVADLNDGAGFLDRLSETDWADLAKRGTRRSFDRGDYIFAQGDPHQGIWVVETGRVRTFYVGSNGREMTLAYWTPGHFVGGPEVFGGGSHIWSADVIETCILVFLPGAVLRQLVVDRPQVALAIIDGLVAKGKCYSALVQMLGTKSIAERLRLLLRTMAESHGKPVPDGREIDRVITHEQFAMLVGATRQWVSVSLDRMQTEGLISITRRRITLHDGFFGSVDE